MMVKDLIDSNSSLSVMFTVFLHNWTMSTVVLFQEDIIAVSNVETYWNKLVTNQAAAPLGHVQWHLSTWSALVVIALQ